ncbi:Histone-lysine N-methyltransferase set9 [Dissophora ornata]|nr:Histone-lysine N-methyltransferase set9 [Dissophora ornata]
MDLQTLSTLDDLLSDVLLDGIHLWFQTHKMNKDYRPMRLPPGKILDIIQRRVIVDRKVPEAVKELLEIEPIKKLFKTDKETQDFTTHARRYLNIYLPTAGFEISQTDRYSAVTNKSEACVIANRPFEVGLELRYCAGTIANLNEQEEKDLENRTSDFSVIKTSRRGTCLFLGPARFVNHDCEPNCSFMSAGANVIYFKVLKSINVNDEITTHYGDNYFGVNNQECLCATCERRGEGGYKKTKSTATEALVTPTLVVDEDELPARRLRNRGKNVNYYPTLLAKSTSKQPRTPPKTTSPPIESDTIPITAGPLTPVSQIESELTATPSSMTEGESEFTSTASPMPEVELTAALSSMLEEEPTSTPSSMPDSELELTNTPSSMPGGELSVDDNFESILATSMDLLQVSQTLQDTEVQQRCSDRLGSITEEHVDVELSTAAPKNFRMSIDFLCHSTMRVTAGKDPSRDTSFLPDSSTESGSALVDSTEGTAQHGTIDDDGTAAGNTAVNNDPARCETCKDTIPKHEMGPAIDCRRCHRHFTIYSIAWPSRSNQAIAAKLQKHEREAAMKLKAEQMALEAERLRKKKLAADAARRTAKAAARAEARARQARVKAEMKARAEAQKALYPFGCPPLLPVQRIPGSRESMAFNISAIITEQHPYQNAPYVVFVDPQDGGESRFWWIAVTVPRNQMDPSMPDLPKRDDGTVDPDLIVVRFLEDFKYSVCNVSGLKLFNPDQEPYRGYVNALGREFVKNLGVKRALAFMRGDISSGLPWRFMSFRNQLSLPEVAMVTRRVEMQIQNEHLLFQKLPNSRGQYQEYPYQLQPPLLEGAHYQHALFERQAYQQLLQQSRQQNPQLRPLMPYQERPVQFETEEQLQLYWRNRYAAMLGQQLPDNEGSMLFNSNGNQIQQPRPLYEAGQGYTLVDQDIPQRQDSEHSASTQGAATQPTLKKRRPHAVGKKITIRIEETKGRKPGARGLGKKTIMKRIDELKKGLDLETENTESAISTREEIADLEASLTTRKYRTKAVPAVEDEDDTDDTAELLDLEDMGTSLQVTKRISTLAPAFLPSVVRTLSSKSRAAPVVGPTAEQELEPTPKPKSRSKSRAKPGSVIWWPRAIAARRPSSHIANLKPRIEDGGLLSHRLLVSSICTRFKSLPTLLFSDQNLQTSAAPGDRFETDYQLLERQILGDMDNSGCLESDNQGDKSALGATHSSPHDRSDMVHARNRSSFKPTNVSSRGSSSGSSKTLASSLPPSSACSLVGEDEQYIDIVGTDSLDESGVQSTAIARAFASTASKTKSRKKTISVPPLETTVVSATQDGKSNSRRKSLKKRRIALDNAVNESIHNTTRSSESTTAVRPFAKPRSRKPKNAALVVEKASSRASWPKPKSARTELERLQEWTIKNSLPNGKSGSSRNRSGNVAKVTTASRQTLPKKAKSELEMLKEWSIKNSLPEDDNDVNDEDITARPILTREGRKRSRAQAHEGGAKRTTADAATRPKRRRVEPRPSDTPPSTSSDAMPLASTSTSWTPGEAVTVVVRSSIPVLSPSPTPTPTSVPAPSRAKSLKKMKKKPAARDNGDNKGHSRGDHKELQNLLQWTIKDSTVDIKLGPNIRTVRSRTKATSIQLAGNDEQQQKPANTVPPKFRVGEEVLAPAEDEVLFDAQIREIRDHKVLQDVYEYKVHYKGYGSGYDTWIEERMIMDSNCTLLAI